MGNFRAAFEAYGADYDGTMRRFLGNEAMYLRVLGMLPRDGSVTLLAARTGMETHLAEDPIRAVALGLEQTLPHLAKRQEGVLNLARRRQLTV